ncbi:MAG: hypothetical protein WCF68_00460 [Terriglobales bacterium]
MSLVVETAVDAPMQAIAEVALQQARAAIVGLTVMPREIAPTP